ncbi:MAG: glycoside hydrolase family 15 protein [Pseudobdellovibrio sp.]|jgi:GH15 family glucan-1,4-alpha-glucosidase|nr:glycoside hydrolase family 15 protein [Pseudobdellovibrio sp.]
MTNLNSPHTYPFGIIGNCNFIALVDTQASIKWMCWPKFDSSFIFGSLLDEKGGVFSIAPPDLANAKSSQRYLENTNVLVTRFHTDEGSFEVIDFAPRFRLHERFHKPLMLFRKIKILSGNPKVKIICNPTGDYGRIQPTVQTGSNHIRYESLEAAVRLTTNAPLTYVSQQRAFTLTEDLYFVLSWGIPLEGPIISTFEDFYKRTVDYWHTWVEHCRVPQIFQREVIRSALTLKLHQYEDTGAIIASCTTSLPEIQGQGRNWDYRFCWLRDTYYTLSALNSLGHFEEMERYSHFIENLEFGEGKPLQPVYCIDGSPSMTEKILDLKGYQNESPVRVGNEAALQVQYDAYGQALLALFHLYTDPRLLNRRRVSDRTLSSLLGGIESTMEKPDNGVWEFRGKQAVHSYTLLFHWAGSAACRKIAERTENKALAARALEAMVKAEQMLEKCFDPEIGAYTQAVGSKDLDASALQLITMGYFTGKNTDRAISHIRAVQKSLEIEPGYLNRYVHPDDFGEQKSAFLICSYWLIESMAVLGFKDEALEYFKKVLATQNHVGLMAEDFDVETKSQWGNFPQTYSHVGLINSAFALDKAMNKPPYL